ncbi:MAG TPA: limonene-1,2-epoxide hydrolase family protein [Pseudonocardia sp.]|jgi:limonene-1,2-epoxide hydrolase
MAGMIEPGDLVREFFASWAGSFDAMCAAFRARFGPDCDWDQRPMVRTTGPEAAVRFLERTRALGGLDTIGVDLLSLAVTGNTVHTERVDHLRRADGSLIASAPVAGVLTLRDDRIVRWREYFDPTGLAFQALTSGAVAVTRSAGRGLAKLRAPVDRTNRP